MLKGINTIHHVPCLKGLKKLPDNSMDACVTDPPWGIKFMGRKWDYDIPPVEVWQEVWRVLKPGAHILVACGTRTQHRMAVKIEDAGFEIRDVICWHYGQGFPKSLDISKAIDKAAGAVRKIVGISSGPNASSYTGDRYKEKRHTAFGIVQDQPDKTRPETAQAKQWDGWGTALKPATEFWTLARKPISEQTIAQNMVKHGTGGLNIDTSRIEYEQGGSLATNPSLRAHINGGNGGKIIAHEETRRVVIPNTAGRFPANVILDESTAKEMDRQSGLLISGRLSGNEPSSPTKNIYGKFQSRSMETYGDSGGASRFFYVAKATARERGGGNIHPTVKPLALMTYLIKLICPLESGRIILDPFAGSGTTCMAARALGLDFIAFEINKDYISIADKRLKH